MQCPFILPRIHEDGWMNCQGEQGHTGGHYKHGSEPKADEQKRWYERTHCGECGRKLDEDSPV
jgi:hypothetical protein